MKTTTALTVKSLIKMLKQMPPNAKVMFMNPDEPEQMACVVEMVDTFETVAEGIGDDGEKILKEAGLKVGQVILQGVTK